MKISKFFKILIDLKFSILLLFVVSFFSSLGSFIEQDQSISFYEQNYPSIKPFYGFIDQKFIFFFGLDHIYRTWWFLLLLFLLAGSLLGCTITRQFPLLVASKRYFFKNKKESLLKLPFFNKIKTSYYFSESIISKIQQLNFFLYQKKDLLYAYKGLIGRISPILVHISLLLILFGSLLGAFHNLKAEEIVAKGEIFHIQNPIKVGFLTSFPNLIIRVNDFWLEYEKGIRQFYSNLSILDNYGKEIIEKTISVNNPLRYYGTDFYQSDWNLIGLREITNLSFKKNLNNIPESFLEYPLYPLKENTKLWITFFEKNFLIVIDTFEDKYFLYDKNFQFLNENFLYSTFDEKYSIVEILSSTGLLIKNDPSIPIIYLGFAGLILTTFLSYLPYTQIWIFPKKNYIWFGSLTNRGKIQLEIDFENFLRVIEKFLIIFEKRF